MATQTKSPIRSQCRFDADDRQRLETLVRSYQVTLRLQDWTLEVDWSEDSMEGSYASIQLAPTSRHGTIFFAETMADLDHEAQRQVLVHELLHCHLHSLAGLAEASARAAAGKAAGDVVTAAIWHEVEHTVDHLADAITPLLAATASEDA